MAVCEKRSLEETVYSAKNVLLDIEGTTTSISFVKDTLFPYVRKSLESYISANWDKDEFKEVLTLLREQATTDVESKVEGVVAIPKEGSADEQQAAVVSNVLWQMDNDRKTTALKQLQGLVWRLGYKDGELKGHVYPDVAPALRRWTENGRKLYVYSSGSVEAQKLLFKYSQEGDLSELFSGHFDTTVGPKVEADSYKAILKSIDSKPDNVIFLTDVPKEASAAREAGLPVVLVTREDSEELSADEKGDFSSVSTLEDVVFSASATKRQKVDTEANGKSEEKAPEEKMDVEETPKTEVADKDEPKTEVADKVEEKTVSEEKVTETKKEAVEKMEEDSEMKEEEKKKPEVVEEKKVEEAKPVEEKKEEVTPVEEKKEEVKPVEEKKEEEVKPVDEKKEEVKPVEEKKEEVKPVEEKKEEVKPVEETAKPSEETKKVEVEEAKKTEEEKVEKSEEKKVEKVAAAEEEAKPVETEEKKVEETKTEEVKKVEEPKAEEKSEEKEVEEEKTVDKAEEAVEAKAEEVEKAVEAKEDTEESKKEESEAPKQNGVENGAAVNGVSNGKAENGVNGKEAEKAAEKAVEEVVVKKAAAAAPAEAEVAAEA